MWKKLLIWPGISLILVVLYRIYELMYPCNSGLFIGGCGMATMMVYLFVFETWAVYFIVGLVFITLERKTEISIPLWMYGGTGISVAILLLVNTLRIGINAFIILGLFGGMMEILRIIG